MLNCGDLLSAQTSFFAAVLLANYHKSKTNVPQNLGAKDIVECIYQWINGVSRETSSIRNARSGR